MKAPECRPRLRRPVARLARAAPREGGAPSEAAASHAKANGAAPPPPLAKMIRNNNCSSVLATSGPFSAVSLQIRLMLLHFSICNEIYKINKLNFEKCVKNLLHIVSEPRRTRRARRPPRATGRRQRLSRRLNLAGLVLGCIEAKSCKKICVGKLSPRSTQCTTLHSSAIAKLCQKCSFFFVFSA